MKQVITLLAVTALIAGCSVPGSGGEIKISGDGISLGSEEEANIKINGSGIAIEWWDTSVQINVDKNEEAGSISINGKEGAVKINTDWKGAQVKVEENTDDGKKEAGTIMIDGEWKKVEIKTSDAASPEKESATIKIDGKKKEVKVESDTDDDDDIDIKMDMDDDSDMDAGDAEVKIDSNGISINGWGAGVQINAQ